MPAQNVNLVNSAIAISNTSCNPVPVTVIVNGESTSELCTAMHDRVVINYLKDSVSDVWKVQSVSYSNYVNTDF